MRIRLPLAALALCLAAAFPLAAQHGPIPRTGEQGPDGLLYVLADERDGAVLKLKPAE